MSEEESRVIVMEGSWSAAQAAREIVAGGAQDEPFYVCDLRELAARHARWRRLMPRVEPFYAVKCNDDKMLLRTLAALGTGFDCASRGEIELVTGLGVAPERIIYAHTIKMASHVRITTFDSEAELIKIKKHMPHAQVVLRIRCDATRSELSFGEKFGCNAETEAPALLKLAGVLGLDLIGVSFHVGTVTEELEAYERGIRHCRELFQLAAKEGHSMNLVDIGGGFPGSSGSSIKEVSAVINAALETHFPEAGVHVIAEPGRYFAAAAYTLAVMVHGKREVIAKDLGDEAHTLYYVNAGVYGALYDVLFLGEQFEPVLLQPSSAEPKPCSIWGPSCCPLDRIVASTSLPPLEVGSWLLFKDMGAYTRTLATKFNGFAPPRVTYFVDRCLWSSLKEQRLFSALPCAGAVAQQPVNGAVFVECALK